MVGKVRILKKEGAIFVNEFPGVIVSFIVQEYGSQEVSFPMVVLIGNFRSGTIFVAPFLVSNEGAQTVNNGVKL